MPGRGQSFCTRTLNLQLREDLLKKKLPLKRRLKNPSKKVFKCDQCDNNFQSENGLKIHIGKAHKNSTLATPDRLRQQPGSSVSLSASSLLDTSREEPSEMSPEPVEKCRKCFSKPPLSICTEDFCKQCCIEAKHLFKVHSPYR